MSIPRFAVLALATATALSPLSALARTDSAELTLQQPAARDEYIIDGATWTCEGTSCRSGFVDDMPALRSCKRVVSVTGAATSFSWRGKTLTDAELAICNTRSKR